MKESVKKLKEQFHQPNKNQSKPFRLHRCSVCGKRFKYRSHLDVICNSCWQDNETLPYVALRFRRVMGPGSGFFN